MNERLNMILKPEAARHLEHVENHWECPTYTSAIEKALRIASRIAEELEKGGSVCVRRKDGTPVELIF